MNGKHDGELLKNHYEQEVGDLGERAQIYGAQFMA